MLSQGLKIAFQESSAGFTRRRSHSGGFEAALPETPCLFMPKELERRLSKLDGLEEVTNSLTDGSLSCRSG